MTGPCLNPWPDPPPTSQTLSQAGWRSMTKSVSGVVSYWQTRVSTTGAPAIDGNRSSQVAPAEPDRLGIDDALAVGRVEDRAVAVRREFHAAPGDGRDPVHRGVVVDPAGEPLRVESAVTGGRAEEQHVLLGHPDEVARDIREEARKPGPGREDERAARVDASRRGDTTSRSRRPSLVPGMTQPSSNRPPSAANDRATAATPFRAMSRPASGSNAAKARSSAAICGQRVGHVARFDRAGSGCRARSAWRSSAPRSRPRAGRTRASRPRRRTAHRPRRRTPARPRGPRATSACRRCRHRATTAGSASRRRTWPAGGRPRTHRSAWSTSPPVAQRNAVHAPIVPGPDDDDVGRGPRSWAEGQGRDRGPLDRPLG